MEPGNYYEDKSKRQFVNQTKKNATQKTGQKENSSEKWKDTAKGVGTDLVVGVLGGGLVAAAIGKPALFVGLAISGYGHYAQNKMISALGLGIMASGTMSALNNKSEAPVLSERVRAFGEELKRKLFLDKLLPSKVENLNGPKSNVIKQPAPTPKASDFVKFQDQQQEKQAENPTHLNVVREMQQESTTEEWDFNERIY
jgi:hypothetical protein